MSGQLAAWRQIVTREGQANLTVSRETMALLIAEIDHELGQLAAWKESALARLNEWHELEALVPVAFTAAHLGMPWPHIVRDYIHSLTRPTMWYL